MDERSDDRVAGNAIPARVGRELNRCEKASGVSREPSNRGPLPSPIYPMISLSRRRVSARMTGATRRVASSLASSTSPRWARSGTARVRCCSISIATPCPPAVGPEVEAETDAEWEVQWAKEDRLIRLNYVSQPGGSERTMRLLIELCPPLEGRYCQS